MRDCRCGRPLDSRGHHRAFCARAVILGRRGWAVENAAVRICRETGGIKTTNVIVRDLHVVGVDLTWKKMPGDCKWSWMGSLSVEEHNSQSTPRLLVLFGCAVEWNRRGVSGGVRLWCVLQRGPWFPPCWSCPGPVALTGTHHRQDVPSGVARTISGLCDCLIFISLHQKKKCGCGCGCGCGCVCVSVSVCVCVCVYACVWGEEGEGGERVCASVDCQLLAKFSKFSKGHWFWLSRSRRHSMRVAQAEFKFSLPRISGFVLLLLRVMPLPSVVAAVEGVGKGSHQQAPRHNATGQSVAVPKQRVPMSLDPIQSRQTQASARHMYPAVQEALSKAKYQATRTTCVRAHPVDQKFCRTETEASRTGQGSNRESARGSELGHGLSEGGGKVARRGRTEAC